MAADTPGPRHQIPINTYTEENGKVNTMDGSLSIRLPVKVAVLKNDAENAPPNSMHGEEQKDRTASKEELTRRLRDHVHNKSIKKGRNEKSVEAS